MNDNFTLVVLNTLAVLFVISVVIGFFYARASIRRKKWKNLTQIDLFVMKVKSRYKERPSFFLIGYEQKKRQLPSEELIPKYASILDHEMKRILRERYKTHQEARDALYIFHALRRTRKKIRYLYKRLDISFLEEGEEKEGAIKKLNPAHTGT